MANKNFASTGIRVEDAIDKYGDMIQRICFLNLKNRADVEDVFQEVFLKLYTHRDEFKSDEHIKAWLCRVAFNQCKDLNKSFWRRNVGPIEDLEIPYETPEESELIPAVLDLPTDWKQVIYLHFYESMTIPEIAKLMNRNINTVYTMLRRAKDRLKKELQEDYFSGNL